MSEGAAREERSGSVAAAPADAYEYSFQCPLPNGLHARPAGQLAAVSTRFASEITLTNERTAAVANAKSVLAMVAINVKLGDSCRLRLAGADAETAHSTLTKFILNVLPGCDELLPVSANGNEVALPQSLRKAVGGWVRGTVVCPGIGQGRVVSVGGLTVPTGLAEEAAGPREPARQHVHRALAAVRAGLEAKLAARPSAVEAGILHAHLSIASDVALVEKIDEQLDTGGSAGLAIVEAGRFFAARLKTAESAYVRERAIDVEDICRQLLEHIYGQRCASAGIELTQPSIVAAENLTPRQLLSVDKRYLKGLVLEHVGATSHAAILARSFNIPTLTGAADVRTKLLPGREAIVDANLGIVIPEVTEAVKRYYERERRKLGRRQQRLVRHVHQPAVTRDGQRLEVAANVASAEALAPAFAAGADGIGLFRTEMLFLEREAPPSEDEQFAAYVQAARAAGGRPVIIRTIDVGGDKPVPYLHLPRETNPFLGYRGVRIYSAHREIFDAQLRAILRASAFGRIWVMAPMIATLDEVRWIKARIAETQSALRSAGAAFDPGLRFGVMIEVPSAAFIIDQLAAEVDFFSIGTNDLAQYFLAVDRGSEKVAGLYSACHPALLRLLSKIVEDAHRHGRWVGMCGEMTRSARNLPLLLGLGLDEISTAAVEIPTLKAAVAQLDVAECRTLLARAMRCGSAAEVEGLLSTVRLGAASHGLLDSDLITVGSDSVSKEEAIKEIVDGIYAAGRTDHPQSVEAAVWAREGVYPTGLGHGFAVPHCKSDAMIESSIGVVRLSRPIEWGSVDGEPVQCVILLASRASDQDGAHMKVFSKLARKLMHESFRARLLTAPDRDGVLACLAAELGIPADSGA
jgi:fructose-specific PTS system IIA-like component